MYQLAIFDLDGTLLDTLADLRQGLNYALSTQGFAPRTLPEVRAFVGNGIRKLIERAVPAGTDEAQIEAVFEAFNPYYAVHNQQIHPLSKRFARRGGRGSARNQLHLFRFCD